MKTTPDVIAAGHICLDIIPGLQHVDIPRPEAFFAPGKLRLASPATLSTGGPVSNTGLGLAIMGMQVALMGKVGDDPFGRLLRMLLEDNWGITTGMIVDESAVTSYTVVIAPGRYDRMFLHCPGANDTFKADDIDYELVSRARVFHFGYPPLMRGMYADDGEGLAEVFRRARECGVTTSLDMALPDPASDSGKARWDTILEKVLPYVDIYLPSAEETLFMLDRSRFDEFRRRSNDDMLALFTGDDLHELSGTLLEMGSKAVVIKCGYRGAYVRTGNAETLGAVGKAKPGDMENWSNRELWHPAFTIDVPPNATGSGDSAIAGFFSAYLRGLPIEDTMRYANAAGGCNVTAPDALSGIIPWDELTAKLESGWKSAQLTVEGKGWRQAGNIWLGPADRGKGTELE